MNKAVENISENTSRRYPIITKNESTSRWSGFPASRIFSSSYARKIEGNAPSAYADIVMANRRTVLRAPTSPPIFFSSPLYFIHVMANPG